MARMVNYDKMWQRKANKGMKSISAIFSAGNRAYKAYQAESRRQERARAAYNARLIRAAKAAEREAAAAERQRVREHNRLERERLRWEKEQARIQKENEKLAKQAQFEVDVKAVKDENFLWRNLHSEIAPVITEEECLQTINEYQSDKENATSTKFYTFPIPTMRGCRDKVVQDSEKEFSFTEIDDQILAKMIEIDECKFEIVEPDEDAIRLELEEKGKGEIKAFWPWTRKKRIKAYIDQHLQLVFNQRHTEWEDKKEAWEKKKQTLHAEVDSLNIQRKEKEQIQKDYIEKRAQSLYDSSLESWKHDRIQFFDERISEMKAILAGESSNIEEALADILSNEELPIEYFIEYMYDQESGQISIDLDLPEVEDVPTQKIALTPSGKESIRAKSQKDIKEDYVYAICGLAFYIAENIFNISPRINNIVISGYTQREDAKTNLITDQYVYLINIDRITFNKIDFSKFNPIQLFSFFKHHIDVTKSFVLKEINLENAYSKMADYTPTNYDDYSVIRSGNE